MTPKSWKENLGLIIGLAILAVILPIYTYLISFKDWVFDLSEKGTIGDAIGGITAPIIGIIGAVLVYLSFRSQVRANELLSNQNEFKLLIELITELKKDILYIYDRNNWDKHTITAPYLAYLKKGDIKSVHSVFKRKLMYVFNDYIFLNKRLDSLRKMEDSDKSSIMYSLGNIYDCYLDNYCIAYKDIDFTNRPKAKLSEKIHDLAKEIIELNKQRPIVQLEDDLD